VKKITFEHDDGMKLEVKPEQLALVDNNGQATVLVTKTDHVLLPLVFFKPLLATEDEIKAREPKTEKK
jgi:hypothetical protein